MNSDDKKNKLIISRFIIIICFTIMSLVLCYIDREGLFNVIFISKIITSIFNMISALYYGLHYENYDCIGAVITSFVYNAIPIEYINAARTDFIGIIIFLNVINLISIIMIFVDRDDYY